MHRVRTVLVVEDDPEFRAAVREGFERAGYRVLEAPDGRSALARLGQGAPDLMLIDVILPEMSGYELCEHIRRSAVHAQVPVLMYSARDYPEDRAHALEAGANEFLSKSAGLHRLRATTELLIARAVPQAEAVA